MAYKPRELEQIRYAEERTMLANDDLGVRNNEIRPLLWNRADCPVIDLQQEASSIKVAPFAHHSELLAAEWMKRMRDAHKARPCVRNTCILD